MKKDIKNTLDELAKLQEMLSKSCGFNKSDDEDQDDQMGGQPPMDAPPMDAPPADAPPAGTQPMDAPPADAPPAEGQEGQGQQEQLMELVQSLSKEDLGMLMQLIQAKMQEPELGDVAKSVKVLQEQNLALTTALTTLMKSVTEAKDATHSIRIKPSNTVSGDPLNKSVGTPKKYNALSKNALRQELRKSRNVPTAVLSLASDVMDDEDSIQDLYALCEGKGYSLPEKK